MNKKTMFDPLKFRDAINMCVRNRNFNGMEIDRDGDIYYEIGRILNRDDSTVRKWTYEDSNGPGLPAEVEKLEELLKVSLRVDDIEAQLMKEKTKIYTPYAKENINKAYIIMQEYINSQEVGEEERLGQFWCEFEKLKAGIPKEIYEKMENFSTENFDPMIWNFEPEITQEFLDCVNEVREKLSEFCEKEITPIVAY